MGCLTTNIASRGPTTECKALLERPELHLMGAELNAQAMFEARGRESIPGIGAQRFKGGGRAKPASHIPHQILVLDQVQLPHARFLAEIQPVEMDPDDVGAQRRLEVVHAARQVCDGASDRR